MSDLINVSQWRDEYGLHILVSIRAMQGRALHLRSH